MGRGRAAYDPGMSIRSWWAGREPGTGRLILLLCVFVPLGAYLLWAVSIASGDNPPSHPAAAEFRLVSIDGRPVRRMAGCRNHPPGGRMLLGKDGRWWMREMDCRTMRWPQARSGTYRWYGDTLRIHREGARWGEFPTHVLVQRGDTIDVPREHAGRKYVSRYVRVRTTAPDSV